MADTTTTNYAFVKPEVGGSANTWGQKLNDDLDAIDAAIKAAQDDASQALADLANYLPLAGGTMTGNLLVDNTDWSLVGTTEDGTDTQRLSFAAGGSVSTSRGAYIQLHGNEHATDPGKATIAAGAGFNIDLLAPTSAIRANTANFRVDADSGTADLYFQVASVDVGGVFGNATQTVLWNGNGLLRLRPNGRTDASGQAAIDSSGNLTVAGTVSDASGDVRRVLVNTQNSAYTIALSDLGKVVRKTGSSAVNYTINPEGTTAYGDGFIFTVRNFNAAGNITVVRGSGVALRIAGSSVDKNVTVAPWGQATFVREASDVWSVTGTGIS